MELVQETMVDRREDDANAGDKSDSAKQRIAAGEKFASGGLNWSERAHAGEDHRGVRKRVEPRQLFEIMISNHANAERGQNYRCAENGATRQT